MQSGRWIGAILIEFETVPEAADLETMLLSPSNKHDLSNPSWMGAVAISSSLAIAVSWAWSRYHQNKQQAKPWMMAPGRLPIIGHAHLIPSVGKLPEILEAWAAECSGDNGCFEIDMLGRRLLIISSEERAMEIVRQRPFVAVRPIQFVESANSIGAKSVFSAEGDLWKLEHKLVSPALNKANVQDYLVSLKVVARRLVQKWTVVGADQNTPLVIAQDLSNMSADSIGKVTLDQDFDFLNTESQVGNDIDKVMAGFITRGMSPFCYWNIPIVGPFLDGLGWSIRRTTAMIDKIVKEYVDQGGDESKRTFIQKVYSQMHSTKCVIPRERLVGNVIGLFMAGTDTTAKTLVACFYMLARDQDLQSILRKEADGIDLEAASLQDFYMKIPRIKSFLHEVHRLHGVPGKQLMSCVNENMRQT